MMPTTDKISGSVKVKHEKSSSFPHSMSPNLIDSLSLSNSPVQENTDGTPFTESSVNILDDVKHARDAPNDHITRVMIQRKQPLLELVTSEEGYVRRLRMVRDFYMPLVPSARTPHSTDVPSSNIASTTQEAISTAPTVPDDLAIRWRILWGNWIQLCEWHSTFLDRLREVVDTDPDSIPKLFIDSRARLRSIYSKYCENHRKAALIADQYHEYFDELRVHFNDKEDVVSYLMQPVQRIMRYQLPMSEIVKYTERADSPNLLTWKRALDIMKEIPKDTQLILEAARIDGFSGVITALGNILIRGNLMVATASREQLLETVAGYKQMLQEVASSLGLSDPQAKINSSTPLSSSIPKTTDSLPVPHGGPNDSNRSMDGTNTESSSMTSGLFTGTLKFTESRLFLFEQMLVVTEEIKPKRRPQAGDVFGQSTYQFRTAINVNKMRYEPNWYNVSLPNGNTNADAAAVDHFLSMGVAQDDLRFAVLDQSLGRDVVYIIDPITLKNRGAWVVQLRDIQRMQQELLLALQDPRRFKTSRHDDPFAPELGDGPNLLSRPEEVISVKDQTIPPNQQQQQRTRKWPSFTVKRPTRLGSASLPASGSKDLPSSAKSKTPSPMSKSASSFNQESNGCKNPNLVRSVSAERRPILSQIKHVANQLDGGASQSANRKLSLTPNSSLKPSSTLERDSFGSSSKHSVVKKRSVFASLFGRNKFKHREYRQTSPICAAQPDLLHLPSDSSTPHTVLCTQMEEPGTTGVSTSG